MKIIWKILGYGVISIFTVVLFIIGLGYLKMSVDSSNNMSLLGEEVQVLTEAGITFRDLNKNGKLDTYENPQANVEDRTANLLDQMTLEEKAGMLFLTLAGVTPKGEPMETPVFSSDPMDIMMPVLFPSNSELIIRKKINSFTTITSLEAKSMAKYHNTIQKIAERTRLGIPITLATDPRHGADNNPGAAIYTPDFSQWPSSLGLAATRDTTLVKEFADIARQEYLSVGFRLALHPMADLATEPRWGRASGTFGEDAALSAIMTKAYVLGFQGDSLSPKSVACMIKHFPGGGPQKGGEDAHFHYGKEQVYPGNNFDYHLIPFVEGAFSVNTAQLMPYYGIPIGQTDEEVAFGFNKAIITRLLRDSLKFDGVVCTDFSIISDTKMMKVMKGGAAAWGVEDLSPRQRVKKVLEAGCDQFGGENIPELVVELVESGEITEERIDVSVKRILRDKFLLGLFDDPYVNEEAVEKTVGNDEFRRKGIEAQRKSVVLLKNDELLPLRKGIRLFLQGINKPETFKAYGTLVDNPEDADIIVSRLSAPADERNKFILETFFRQGRLYYSEEEKQEIFKTITQKPSVVIATLDRAAVLTEIDKTAKAMIVEFGINETVLAEAIFGEFNPSGKLPFELPSSWEAVEKQLEDIPYDSKDPLYPFGHGLSYQ